MAEAYLASLRRRGLSERTNATYRYPLRRFLSFLSTREAPRLADVTRADLAAWRLRLLGDGLADASMDLYLRAVRGFMRWLEDEGSIFENPATGLRAPRAARRLLSVHGEAEIARLGAQPSRHTDEGIRDRAVIELAYGCALRREELAGLCLCDLDLAQRALRVLGKGRRERMLPVGDAAAERLEHYLRGPRIRLLGRGAGAAAQALWIGAGGRELGGRGVADMMRRHSMAAGISPPVTPHGLRRACATHMLQRGAHPAQIQILLGHATSRHLSAYLRLTIVDVARMHRASRLAR